MKFLIVLILMTHLKGFALPEQPESFSSRWSSMASLSVMLLDRAQVVDVASILFPVSKGKDISSYNMFNMPSLGSLNLGSESRFKISFLPPLLQNSPMGVSASFKF